MVEHSGHLYEAVYTDENVGTWIGFGDTYKEQGVFVNADNVGLYGTCARGWQVAAGNEIYPQGHTTGENGAGKNMPPYVAVNIWKRVA